MQFNPDTSNVYFLSCCCFPLPSLTKSPLYAHSLPTGWKVNSFNKNLYEDNWTLCEPWSHTYVPVPNLQLNANGAMPHYLVQTPGPSGSVWEATGLVSLSIDISLSFYLSLYLCLYLFILPPLSFPWFHVLRKKNFFLINRKIPSGENFF